MALNLDTITDRALTVVFNLGSDIVKSADYYRPPSFNPNTGVIATAEQKIAVSMIVGQRRIRSLDMVFFPTLETVLIRASELTAISAPAKGDYIIDATGVRRDVIDAPRLDPTGKLWRFETERSVAEDWGDLTAAGSSEDFGDLTAATSFEDRGALF